MAQFSSSERLLARLFSRFPFVKALAKRGYQYANFIFYKKNYNYRSEKPIVAIGSGKESFFGYYDKSPMSADGKKIIFHESDYSTLHKPSADKYISICLFDKKEDNYTVIAKSSAFNWQQGSRLQWLTDTKFIFNVFENGFKSKIYDTTLKNFEQLPFPIYDCYSDDYAITLNFQRLATLRPDYGYRNLGDLGEAHLRDLASDGLFHLDLRTKKYKLIISLQDLVNIFPNKSMGKGLHKINHIMISPNGKRFIFLHRYFLGKRRFDRLFVADVDGGNIKALADHDMVSHCTWLGNHEIVGYLRDYKLGDNYYRINVDTGNKSMVGEGVIDHLGDGHPSVYGEAMLFDTYPNKSRMKELFVFDLKTSKLTQIGEYHESLRYHSETRCDLHPRFSMDGKRIFFDSVHEGSRKLYVTDWDG